MKKLLILLLCGIMTTFCLSDDINSEQKEDVKIIKISTTEWDYIKHEVDTNGFCKIESQNSVIIITNGCSKIEYQLPIFDIVIDKFNNDHILFHQFQIPHKSLDTIEPQPYWWQTM